MCYACVCVYHVFISCVANINNFRAEYLCSFPGSSLLWLEKWRRMDSREASCPSNVLVFKTSGFLYHLTYCVCDLNVWSLLCSYPGDVGEITMKQYCLWRNSWILISAGNSASKVLIEKHAPLQRNIITLRFLLHPNAPWYPEELLELNHKRRDTERLWRRAQLNIHHQLEETDVPSKIAECWNSQKDLFKKTQNLMAHKGEIILSSYSSDNDLANKCSDFFMRKPATIRHTIINNIRHYDDIFLFKLTNGLHLGKLYNQSGN